MPDPILTLGDLEPERPLVAINRRVPDGPWQRIKARYFDVLLRWLPVRYVIERKVYPMRLPNQLGLAYIAKIQTAQAELSTLSEKTDPASIDRISVVLRDISGAILDAPPAVLDSLTDDQHIRLLRTFPLAVAGTTPQTRPESPPISGASSPVSAASMASTTG